MTLDEAQKELNKLIKNQNDFKKYLNVGCNIEILEIEEAIKSYEKKIIFLKEYIKNYI